MNYSVMAESTGFGTGWWEWDIVGLFWISRVSAAFSACIFPSS